MLICELSALSKDVRKLTIKYLSSANRAPSAAATGESAVGKNSRALGCESSFQTEMKTGGEQRYCDSEASRKSKCQKVYCGGVLMQRAVLLLVQFEFNTCS